MRPVIARGHTTLLTGLWKSGKTTLVANLVRDIMSGSGLASGAERGSVLVVSEESQDHWSRRGGAMGLPEETLFVCRPFRLRPRVHEWVRFVDSLGHFVETSNPALVVIDTIASCWPVNEENDAPEVQQALAPLNRLTESGAALLLVHHPSKADQTQGRASRGSGALPGFVDVIAEFRREPIGGERNRRRLLDLYSRLEGGDGRLLLELTDSGYVNHGGYEDVTASDRRAKLVAALPSDGQGLTADEVRERCKANRGLGLRSCDRELDAAYKAGDIRRSGSGRKGSPFRYAKPVDSIRAGEIP